MSEDQTPIGSTPANQPTAARRHGPTVQLFGAMLMAVGGLIAVLSGACSALTFMAAVASMFSGGVSAMFGMLGLVLVFGAPPIAVGIGLFLWGRRLRR